MWWRRTSEKRFAVWLESAALGLVEEPLAIILPVINDGVWQWTQPIVVKTARPFIVDGVSDAGAGGASIRMKSANASMSERTAVLEGGVEVGVKLNVSSGVALNRQPAVSPRSWGKSWLVTYLDVVCLAQHQQACFAPSNRSGWSVVSTVMHATGRSPRT